MTARCRACNAELADTVVGESCPHCGARVSVNEEFGSGGLCAGGTANVGAVSHERGIGQTLVASESFGAIVVRHWTKLLTTAERLLDASDFGVAVVVAQTACEVVTERAMVKAFKTRNIPELEEPVTDLLFTYALSKKQGRRLFDALTNDSIASKPFWQGYTTMVEHRNAIVHSGIEVTSTEARADLDTARLFVQHVEQQNGLT